MTKLESRISALADVGAELRSYYVPNPNGSGFVLNYHAGAEPSQLAQARDPMAPDLPGGKVTQPSAADIEARREILRESIVQRAVATISPKTEGREALANHYRKLIEIRAGATSDTGEADSMEVAYLMPGGFRRPTIIEGQTGWADFSEWLAHTPVPENLLIAPPKVPTRREAQLADSEPYSPGPRNVTLTAEQSHHAGTYAAAFAEATKRGGELIILPEPEQPEPSFVPNGKDVALSTIDAGDVNIWNNAWAVASARGGTVVITKDRKDAPKPKGGDVLITSADAADLRLFNAARQKAREQFGEMIITDDVQGSD